MILKIYYALFNRNVILIGAIVLGLLFGDKAQIIKPYNLYILAIVMAFSTTGISIQGMLPLKKAIKIMATSTLLGYVIFSGFLLLLSFLFIKDNQLFYGMVIIAASPPGVAVIPFTHVLKGDMNYTMIGTIGAYFASLIIAPLIILGFSGNSSLSPWFLLLVLTKIIVVPFLISRLLLLKPIKNTVIKVRGKIVDFGFALIIFTAVGLNRDVFFQNYEVLLSISVVLILSMFLLGFLHEKYSKMKHVPQPILVSQNLLLTIKSSGFTASTSLAIFGQDAAVPSAVLAVLVLVYLIYLSIRNKRKAKLLGNARSN